MTLIAAGQGLNRRAIAGFRANANLEAQRVQAGDAISAQRDAQAMNTMGTGAGIGAMYGMKGMGGTAAASAPVSSSSAGFVSRQGVSPITNGVRTQGIPLMSPASGSPQLGSAAQLQGMNTQAANALGVSTTAPLQSNVVGTGKAVSALATDGALATTGTAASSGAAAAGAGASAGASAGAGAGAGAGAAAGAGGGAMSSLAAIAGPLAIGLGAAYLITKLFD